MSSAFLDPQPFRDWYAGQKEHHEAEEIARWFGVDSRTLRRWDEGERIRRGEFEDAVIRSHFSLWDIYPDLEDEDTQPVLRGEGTCTGEKSRLTDQQLRVLYAIHTDRKVSIKRLGREVWESLGYASPGSAAMAIGRGFRRLDLKAVHHYRETFGLRLCQGFNRLGRECENLPLAGEDYCYAHHPETRSKLVFHALSVSPFTKEYA